MIKFQIAFQMILELDTFGTINRGACWKMPSSHKLQSNIGLQATTEDIKTKAACDAQICWNTHISFFSWVFRLVQFFRIAKAVFEFMFSSN